MPPMRFTACVAAIGSVLALAACSYTYRLNESPQPLSPQPTAEQLNPGLLPLYITGAVASVDAIPSGNAALSQGRIGSPVLKLDEESPGGRMWESGFSEGYSISLSGLIQLEAGTYRFAAYSDDGVRVTIGGIRVVDDPAMHVARMSEPKEVSIRETGWYPISVQYFQVSGSAALRLHYQPPGAGGLLVAPGAILAHRPN